MLTWLTLNGFKLAEEHVQLKETFLPSLRKLICTEKMTQKKLNDLLKTHFLKGKKPCASDKKIKEQVLIKTQVRQESFSTLCPLVLTSVIVKSIKNLNPGGFWDAL